MNISKDRDRLDRLNATPIPPIWELTICLAGLAIVVLACWMCWGCS